MSEEKENPITSTRWNDEAERHIDDVWGDESGERPVTKPFEAVWMNKDELVFYGTPTAMAVGRFGSDRWYVATFRFARDVAAEDKETVEAALMEIVNMHYDYLKEEKE